MYNCKCAILQIRTQQLCSISYAPNSDLIQSVKILYV